MAIISGASQIARAVGTNVARESARDLAQTAFRNFARNGRNGQLLERGDLERQLERTKLRQPDEPSVGRNQEGQHEETGGLEREDEPLRKKPQQTLQETEDEIRRRGKCRKQKPH